MTSEQRFEIRCRKAFGQFDRKQAKERKAFEAAWAEARRREYRRIEAIGTRMLGEPLCR